MAAAASAYIHWAEVLLVSVLATCFCGRILIRVQRLLFYNGSIVKYWSTELGGKPDENDPYDLNIPVSCFDQRSKTNYNLFTEDGLFSADLDPDTPGFQNDLFDRMRKDPDMPTEVHAQTSAAAPSEKKAQAVAIM